MTLVWVTQGVWGRCAQGGMAKGCPEGEERWSMMKAVQAQAAQDYHTGTSGLLILNEV